MTTGATLEERSALDSFVRRYDDRRYLHTALVRHKGRIVAFAVDERSRFWYAVLDLGGDASKSTGTANANDAALDVAGWPDRPIELTFPRELAEAGYSVAEPLVMPVHANGSWTPKVLGTPLPDPAGDDAAGYDYFLSTTARLSAPVPFQVVSDGAHIYLFRQAIGETPRDDGQSGDPIDTLRHNVYVDPSRRVVVYGDDLGAGPGYVDENGDWVSAARATPVVSGTLLVDRFALAGDRLLPKREVRYQRSRHRTRPASRTDSLGAADLDGNPFYEPTLELTFLGELHVGWFAVLLLPTEVAEISRWQFLVFNQRTDSIDAFNVERSSDGMFNTQGSIAYTCERHPDVYSPCPGSCTRPTASDSTQTCNGELVPRVGTSGAAETAIQFGGETRLALGDPVPIGKRFTVEAWIQPDIEARREAWRLLVDGGGAKPTAGLSISISSSGKLRVGWGDGDRWCDHITVPLVTAPGWHHLAVCSNGTSLRIDVDGIERVKTTTMKTQQGRRSTTVPVKEITPVSGGGILAIGSAHSGFEGIVDEVRVWKSARATADVAAHRHVRLTGLEPDLVAYWRCDEGTGNRVFDQTNHGHHGALHDGSWRASDAPIGEHPGLSRESFVFETREVASAPACLIYHRQTGMPCGYAGRAEDVKHEGRMMLAVATHATGGDPSDVEPYIAALDIGVSAQGRLSHLPDVIALDDMEPEKAEADTAAQAVSMPLIAVDPRGLSVTGGLLRFAWTPTAPYLYESAAGKVTLCFKGADDQFFAAYYTTAADSATLVTLDDSGTPLVNWHAQISGSAPADLEVVTDGRAKNLTVTVRGAGFTETWQHVPRDPKQLAAVINGTAPDAAQEMSPGAYGYDVHASTTLIGADPRYGSRLVRAIAADDAEIPVGKQTAITTGHAVRTCQWTAAAPGHAVHLGLEAVAAATGERAEAAARCDDLTMEAWVRPPQEIGELSLIDQTAEGAGYGLRLVKRPADAFRLNGGNWIRIPDSPALDFAGDITLEAWVLPETLADLHYIVGRSATSGPGAEVFMRIGNGMCEAGSYDTTMDWRTDPHKVQYTLSGPETDGEWIHFAAVHRHPEWILYRNGEEVGRATTAIGAFSMESPWLIGSTGLGLARSFLGGIDDVRIWSRARTRSEIVHDMGRRLLGTEDGLAGYWRLAGGDLRDRSPQSNDGILEGAATPFWFDGAASYVRIPQREELNFEGHITIEAWVRPALVGGYRDIVAHGATHKPDAEVVLRIDKSGKYAIGSWRGVGHGEVAMGGSAVDDIEHRRWVHLAGTYADGTWTLFRNGEIIGQGGGRRGAVLVDCDWAIGARGTCTERFFGGGITDVRIWNIARSQEQIRTWAPRRLFGDEEGLVGYWPFGEHDAHDRSPTGAHGELHDVSNVWSPPRSPLPAYGVVAFAGDTCRHSREVISPGEWTHLAAVYEQSSALRFDGDTRIDCGNDPSLDVRSDLTIEADLRLDDLRDHHGVIGKGVPSLDQDEHVPYTVAIDPAGRLGLSFEDEGGRLHSFWSRPGTVQPGMPQRLAITRERHNDFEEGGSSIWHVIRFFTNGELRDERRWDEEDHGIGGTNQPLFLGRAQVGERSVSLRGSVSQVRLWSTALGRDELHRKLSGREDGLISWWPIDERTGPLTSDRKSTNHGRIRGSVTWINDPVASNSKLHVLIDGRRVSTQAREAPENLADESQLRLGPAGELDEVRIWGSCRTVEQIHDNLFGRLTRGDQEDLLAYYPFDADGAGQIFDHSASACHLDARNVSYTASTAPVGEDTPLARSAILGVRNPFNGLVDAAPAVGEYGDLQLDDAGNLNGVLKRCYSYVRGGIWSLFTGFKVGDLRTTWVGQVQFAPQLKGYIEGAPPVPSENLLPDRDYADATTVELLQAERVERTYASERSAGFDQHTEFLLGTIGGAEVSVGMFGISKKSLDLRQMAGFKGVFDLSLSQLSAAGSGSSRETQRQTRLGLRGGFVPPGDGFATERFVAENVGLALVESETADVFALRLYGNDALVGLQMRPNPDIPRDWNLIAFPIDPRYTKQGTLDGNVGTEADPDYRNAPAPRSEASYFKPIEAYATKQRIRDEEERERVTYARFGTSATPLEPRLPDVFKRNIVNTYVWTADGGFFAETEEKTDTRREVTGGSYEFKGMGGLSTELEFGIFGVGVTFKLDALFGGHLNQLVSKTQDASSLFALAVDLGDVEHDIYEARSGRTPPRKAEGKVDAYRFMTFYLDPSPNWHDEFFGRVVDPIWLAESDSPAAVALRQARQDGKSPACWRVLHRVTYVSRILPKFTGKRPRSLEQQMRSLDIASNYELIKQLEPYVAEYAGDPVALRAAVERTLADRLPELVGYGAEITEYMSRYLGQAGATV